MMTPAGWYQDPHDPGLERYWDGVTWTPQQRRRGPAAPVPFVPLPPTTSSGKWYFVVTILTGGMFAAVPFFHAASRLDRPELRRTGAIFAGAGVLGGALVGSSPTDEIGSPTGFLGAVGVVLAVGVVVAAIALQIGLRREVYDSPRVIAPPSANQSAMANVEATRRKRVEARALATKDPMMARDLGIGRPGNGSAFDDGGLLDLNAATVAQLRDICGLTPSAAEAVVSARMSLGRFLHVDDAINFGQVSEDDAALVRDRGIIIADR